MGTVTRQFVGDSGANDQHMHNESVGGSTADIPLVYEADTPMDFASATSGTLFDDAGGSEEGDVSVEIDCDGKRFVVIRADFKASNGYAKLRPFWRDHGATAHWTAHETDITVSAQSAKDTTELDAPSDSAWFNSRRVVIQTYGAKSVKFRLQDTRGKSTTFAVAV